MGGVMDLTASIASSGPPPATAPRPAAAGDIAGARKSAEDFTSFFLSQSLESMFADVSTGSLFGGGNGEAVYRSLMLQEYGKIAAQSSSGRNIVDAVQREILRLQEQAK